MPNLGGFKDLELDKGRLSLGFAALPAGRKNAGIKKYLCYSFAFRSLVCTFAATKASEVAPVHSSPWPASPLRTDRKGGIVPVNTYSGARQKER